MDKVTLYNKDAKGQLRFWSIENTGEGLEMEYGVWGGESQFQYEDIPYGKASRDLDEQIESRMNSRISSKKDKGYVDNIKEAQLRTKVLNTLGLPKPMLAQRIDKIKEVNYRNSFVQYKYDGHRCMIANVNGDLIAYTRNGKKIDTIDHILSEINIPVDTILDGELYLHGKPLNTITSLIKKKQPATDSLVYICYDIMNGDCYSERYKYIKSLSLGGNVSIAKTYTNMRESQIPGMLDISIKTGYEGLILRQPDCGYEDNKRSKSLVKIKKFLEDDYRVVGILESNDGWAILKCEVYLGIPKLTDRVCLRSANRPVIKTFTVSAPGSMKEKTDILKQKDLYIGKWVNVKYANITTYGIPFHPVAIRFVDKL